MKEPSGRRTGFVKAVRLSKIPCERRMTQSPKEGAEGEREATMMQAIAERIVDDMEEDWLYIIDQVRRHEPLWKDSDYPIHY
jgi:hypothetical protein